MDMGEDSANHCGEDGAMTTQFSIAKRISKFLDKIHHDTYSETTSDIHEHITGDMVKRLRDGPLWPGYGAKVLDVGCGQGYALEAFKKHDLVPMGLTISEDDAKVCRDKGFMVQIEDMTFTSFYDATFDMVWARHCLEHSTWPLLTLHEFNRVLKMDGILYAEMPAPDTSSYHECNENHYSVFLPRNWHSLMDRAGFKAVEHYHLVTKTMMGDDRYYVFVCRKEADV